FRQRRIHPIPDDGLLPAMVPAQVANWILALEQFGTLPLGQVLAPAVELARGGFAMTHGLRRCIEGNQARFREEWPSAAAIYLPGGEVPSWGDTFRNPDWAATCESLASAE